MGSSQKDVRNFPEDVKRNVGFELDEVQCGGVPYNAKPFKGISGVMELVERYDTDTYRAMYAANINGIVYVLHCFKKKSKRGISTPKPDVDLIKQRFKEAVELSKRSKL